MIDPIDDLLARVERDMLAHLPLVVSMSEGKRVIASVFARARASAQLLPKALDADERQLLDRFRQLSPEAQADVDELVAIRLRHDRRTSGGGR